jgi:hypothetical protein
MGGLFISRPVLNHLQMHHAVFRQRFISLPSLLSQMKGQVARCAEKELNPLGPVWSNREPPLFPLQVRDTRHAVENHCHPSVKSFAVTDQQRISPKGPLNPARKMRHEVDNGSGVGAFCCRKVVK